MAAAAVASPAASPEPWASRQHYSLEYHGGSEGAASPTCPSPAAASSASRRRRQRHAEESFEDIIASLTRQKEELRASQASPAKPSRSHSAPELASQVPQQINSNWLGSAAFSFGRPRHTKGSFGLEVLGPRDVGYVPPTGGIVVPGPGAYNFSHADGKDLPEKEGNTGGWSWRQHSIFVETLRVHKGVASPAFFDRVALVMPELSRQSVTDHLRWMADFDHTLAKRHRTVLRFKEEAVTGQSPKEDRREQWIDWKKAKDFRRQADEEDGRWGLKDREIIFQAHQVDEFGQQVGGSFRGHPQFKKSQGHCFGRELRVFSQSSAKRHTSLSHVLSSSALDVPGPGAYCGLDAGKVLLRTAPSFSLHDKMPAQKVDKPAVGGPGYDGPLDGGVRVQRELRVLQNCQPEWSLGKARQRSDMCNKSATEPLVGPGRYEHASAFHSQFPL